MNTRNRRTRKIIYIVNIVLIVYVFSLTIGYSILSETLKISGKVSTAPPEKCPFELQEMTSITDPNAKYPHIKNYHASLDTKNFNTYTLKFPVLQNVPSQFSIGMTFDYYEKNKDTLSVLIPRSWFYYTSNSPNLNFVVRKTPMYFVLKNVTTHDISKFKIKVDLDNSKVTEHNFPFELFDIRWIAVDDMNDVKDIMETDADFSSWNTAESVFKNSSLTAKPYDEQTYYSYDDFQNGVEIEFNTTPISSNEYLVLGLQLPQRKEVSTDNQQDIVWPEESYMSFKFWPSNFSEKSAFYIRTTFTTQDTLSPYFKKMHEVFSVDDVTQALPLFYENPASVPSPWWPVN